MLWKSSDKWHGSNLRCVAAMGSSLGVAASVLDPPPPPPITSGRMRFFLLFILSSFPSTVAAEGTAMLGLLVEGLSCFGGEPPEGPSSSSLQKGRCRLSNYIASGFFCTFFGRQCKTQATALGFVIGNLKFSQNLISPKTTQTK